MNSKREPYTQDPRVRLQDAEFTTLASKVSKDAEFTMLASKDLKRRRARYSEVKKLAFYQLTRESRLQIMDVWISNRLSKLQKRSFQKFQEEIKRQSLFIISDDRASRKQSLVMNGNGKSHSYLKKNSLEGGHHPSRYGHESTRGNAF